MSLQKFRSFEEAERQLWNFNPDEKYYNSVAELFNLFSTLNPGRVERGIYKFKSLEKAAEHRRKRMQIK